MTKATHVSPGGRRTKWETKRNLIAGTRQASKETKGVGRLAVRFVEESKRGAEGGGGTFKKNLLHTMKLQDGNGERHEGD